jgi:hypothetical protein
LLALFYSAERSLATPVKIGCRVESIQLYNRR